MSFDTALNALIDPVIVTDAEGVLTFANARAAERFGSSGHLGMPLADRLARVRPQRADGSAMPLSEHPIARALATQKSVIGAPTAIETLDRGLRQYVCNTTPLFEGGRFVGTLSIFHDVTEQSRMERELADYAARLAAIVDLVTDAVYVLDGEGTLIFANAVGQRLLDLQAHARFDARVQAIDPRDASGAPIPPERLPSKRALRGEEVAGMPLVIMQGEDDRRHIMAGAYPLRTPDGRIYAAVVTWKDVTDEVRTREQLEAAREAAEEANRLKDQFIAALSHELRAPLQPILGWTEVLRRHGKLDAVTTQAVEAIRRNVRQQVRLVDDLLDLSRIMHGKFQLRWETFDLREQVRAAAEPFEETAALKRVKLTIDLPGEPILMWGDGTRVQQIVTNLISNAVKFTPSAGQVAVRLVASETEALIEVEDTGEGIAPEDLGVIFEAFRQSSTSMKRGGLGIGLDLVRRLTELHRGSVEAFSEGLGYGARFRVRLPRARAAALPQRPPTAGGRRLEGRSIMVVEDSADTRDVLRVMLEMEGATVTTADCGQEGVRTAERVQPDVVLCDIGLPDIDGLEVARRIRQRVGRERTRLIALTGYGRTEDMRQALDVGFEAHLTKPINLDQLLVLLAR